MDFLFTLHPAHKNKAKSHKFSAYQIEKYSTYIEQLENINYWVKSNPTQSAKICISLYLTDHSAKEASKIIENMEED